MQQLHDALATDPLGNAEHLHLARPTGNAGSLQCRSNPGATMRMRSTGTPRAVRRVAHARADGYEQVTAE